MHYKIYYKPFNNAKLILVFKQKFKKVKTGNLQC